MGHHHLTLGSRETLERCLKLGYSLRAIGRILGYSAAALCKERKRNTRSGLYNASEAQQRARNRRINAAHQKKKMLPALEEYIFEKMQLYWSPEQVCGRLLLDYPDDHNRRISFKTIYRKIAHGTKKRTKWAVLYKFLRLKRNGKSMKNLVSRKQGPSESLRSIAERPLIVGTKRRFGDWESDLLCGSKGKGHIATFVERSTTYILAVPCRQKSVVNYEQAALGTLGQLPQEIVHTVTVDRGREFYGYKSLEEKLQTVYYFCDARRPNQRGLNEQINGLLRQFFPKNTPLLDIEEELKRAVAFINHRPRKTLGYKTPAEMVKNLGLEQVLTLI